MRLKPQLFLILLFVSGLSIALVYAFSSWNFSRGLLAYVNSAEEQRFQAMSNSLATAYEENGGWDWVQENPRLWREINGSHFPRQRGRRADPEKPATKPRGKKRSGSGRAPPRLVDANKNFLIGNKSDRGLTWLAITIESTTVGYLGYRKQNQLSSTLDRAFERQQKKSFGQVALAMIALSALLSIPLASRFVRPLLDVNKAVGEISQGNFSHRVKTNRKDELGDLAADVNRMGVALEQNRDARQRWIAEISHELRTPIGVLRGEIEAIQDGIRHPDPTSIDSLHNEVLGLGRVVDDLHTLSLSDVGALDYNFSPLDLAQLIKTQVDSHKPQFEKSGLQISFESFAGATTLDADKLRMQQLVSNMLQNSLRYTNHGGEVVITLQTIENDGKAEQLHLQWQDSAPGVADDHLVQLFDPLFRTDESRNRESGGAGLGLAIVERIVKAHEGTLSASHSALGGVQFDMKFPFHTGT